MTMMGWNGLRRALVGAGLAAAAIALTGLGAHAQAQRSWTTIRIGTEGAYPPFNNLNSRGELEGFEIDYAKMLCEKMKVQCTFVAQDWDGIIPALLANKYDVIIAGMNATDERRKRVEFSAVYTRINPAFIGQKSSPTDVSPAALRGKAVGTQASTIHANWLEKNHPQAQVKLYPTQEEANLDLQNGRLDYIVADKIALLDFLKGKGKDCCKYIADVQRDPAIHGDGVAMAFRKEDTALRDMWNKAIQESLADGSFKTVASKWFDFDIM